MAVAFSLAMSAIALWVGIRLVRSPRSYLRAAVKSPPPKWWPRIFLSPPPDPESRSTQLGYRLLGVVIIAFVAVYLYAIAYNLGLTKVR